MFRKYKECLYTLCSILTVSLIIDILHQFGVFVTTDEPVHQLNSIVCIRVHLLCCGGLVAKLGPTLATPWTVARQAPILQATILEWVAFPSAEDLPDLGI